MMMLWAYHLIHRLDDTCHFRIDAPYSCEDFPFAIQTKARWSKNMDTELQCPDQILLGADDWKTCPLLWLSVYLDGWLKRYPNAVHMFTDNDDVEIGPTNLNKQSGNRVKAVCWKHPTFQALNNQTGPDQNGLGTHSNRKWASTRAQRQGANKSQVGLRGRWIGERMTVLSASITSTPRTTTQMQSSQFFLCEGGAIKYVLQEEAQGRSDWLMVIPSCGAELIGAICKRPPFPEGDAIGKALGCVRQCSKRRATLGGSRTHIRDSYVCWMITTQRTS